jgi:hypothetical protein
MQSVDDKRLQELQKQVDDLTQRQAEQQATVTSIRQRLQQTREDDLNREAMALSTGSGAHKPKAKAPSVQRALEDAEHDAEVLSRALEMANGERYRYYAENTQTLDAKLQDAKAAKAREISMHAQPLLEAVRAFYQIDEDAKILKPYRRRSQPTESTEKPRDMLAILGVPQTTANVFGTDKIAGLHRGELEGVLAALAKLPASFPDQEREGAA